MLLSTATLFVTGSSKVQARIIAGELPWGPNGGNPPQTPGGKATGSAVFIDRQLAGAYGEQEGLYVRPRFQAGAKNQGHQSESGPPDLYRRGLAALALIAQRENGWNSAADVLVFTCPHRIARSKS